MPATIGKIVVEPQDGLTVDVTITDAESGENTTDLYTTEHGSTVQTWSDSISSRTVYYVAEPGRYTISAKYAGNEIAGGQGSTVTHEVSHGQSASVPVTLDDTELAEKDTSVSARAWQNTAQSIPDSTATAITLDSESHDTDGIHDTATNNTRMTVPAGKAGLWRFVGQVGYETGNTGGRSAVLRLNGTTVIADVNAKATTDAGNNGRDRVPVADELVLSEGDYVELLAFHTQGTSLNSQTGESKTFLIATFVGTA